MHPDHWLLESALNAYEHAANVMRPDLTTSCTLRSQKGLKSPKESMPGGILYGSILIHRKLFVRPGSAVRVGSR